MKNKLIKNNIGQTMVEGVLLLVVFVTIALTVSNQFKDNKLLAQIVSGPWDRLDGMIQNGTWGRASSGRGKHPNDNNRHVSTSE